MAHDQHDFSGRVVVITGAARGMGAAATRGFLRAGANVVALDLSWKRIDEYWDDASGDQQDLKSAGDRVLLLDGNVAEDADLDRAFQATMDRFGTVDALINNAALLQHHLFKPTGRVKILDTTDQDWEQMLRVNVLGTLKVIRRFIRPMIEQRRGSIVNISTSGTIPRFYRVESKEQPYMASKAAVTNLSVYLAEEVKEHNIAVNVVFPGHAEMTGWQLVDAARRAAGLSTPSSRAVPEHIVPLLMFLATQDASGGLTGRLINTAEWNVRHGYGSPQQWLRENRSDLAVSAL